MSQIHNNEKILLNQIKSAIFIDDTIDIVTILIHNIYNMKNQIGI